VIPINESSLRIREDNIVWRETNDEIVILELQTATYLTLNESGQKLWFALLKGSTLGILVEMLVSEQGATEVQAEADVEAFLAALDERSLLEGYS